MPFRCKCGRTFEKPDSFSTHTSACAPFHRRMSSSTTTGDTSPPSPQTMTSPDFMPNFMPTALSLHNAFEGVRRRSMSYGQAWK
ncbi:uncharacterized protein BYT42DRAFT_536666 [Radiomyces spectabilis]|uniref:uncharacterized protein n=1 Tax=Radiomyces spectabilis TaxID=64574 RepID=UPI00221E70FB|nr:uncharacterized protein BYT42DRAFT_536666 [Radiomyces spectabilis]KAI8373054.1 hypothetical protein BYT42DRAFT_536666 [Radiomyces spectabilis]